MEDEGGIALFEDVLEGMLLAGRVFQAEGGGFAADFESAVSGLGEAGGGESDEEGGDERADFYGSETHGQGVISCCGRSGKRDLELWS